MWSFETPPDLQSKLDWVRNFVSSEVAHLDYLHGHPSDRRSPAARELFRSLRERVRSAGLWGPDLDPAVGGNPMSYLERALLDEVIGTSRWSPSVFGYVPAHAMCARIVSGYADEATRRRLLPGLWNGDAIPAYALNEPYVGATKSLLRTTAARENGAWVLRGEKWFIDDAAFADVLLVVALTRPGAPDKEAFTLFLVPADAEGVELVAVSSLGGQDPRFSSYGQVAFRDVTLPDAAVMGKPDGAYAVIRACRAPINLYEHGRAIGVMRRCLDMMVEHAASHESKQGPLAGFQTTQTALGETHNEVEQARLMVLRAAWEVDTRGVNASLPSILSLKAALPETMARVVRRAAHLHGTLGMSSDMPFASWRAWADALGVSDTVPEACWQELGKIMLSTTTPRQRYSWPEDHIPTATRILAESSEAIRRWVDLT